MMKRCIAKAKEMDLCKGGSKILFMQEEGTDLTASRLDSFTPMSQASHSYKKIVEVQE